MLAVYFFKEFHIHRLISIAQNVSWQPYFATWQVQSHKGHKKQLLCRVPSNLRCTSDIAANQKLRLNSLLFCRDIELAYRIKPEALTFGTAENDMKHPTIAALVHTLVSKGISQSEAEAKKLVINEWTRVAKSNNWYDEQTGEFLWPKNKTPVIFARG